MGQPLGFLCWDMSAAATGTVAAWMASSKVRVKNWGTVLGSMPLGGFSEGQTHAGKTHLAVSQVEAKAASEPKRPEERSKEVAAASEKVVKRIM